MFYFIFFNVLGFIYFLLLFKKLKNLQSNNLIQEEYNNDDDIEIDNNNEAYAAMAESENKEEFLWVEQQIKNLFKQKIE